VSLLTFGAFGGAVISGHQAVPQRGEQGFAWLMKDGKLGNCTIFAQNDAND